MVALVAVVPAHMAAAVVANFLLELQLLPVILHMAVAPMDLELVSIMVAEVPNHIGLAPVAVAVTFKVINLRAIPLLAPD
jgi:hypothetical protein